MSGERQKPNLVVRGKETTLSIWITEKTMKLSVSKKTDSGFERIDSYTIPMDYILFKILESMPSQLAKVCEFAKVIEEKGEPESEDMT